MRKVKNFIYGVWILFPLLVLFFALFIDGYYSEVDSTNFWVVLSADEFKYFDVLNWILPLGDYSYNFLTGFLDGVLPILSSDIAMNVVCWFVDYYILLPVVYLIIKLFTFIPSMLIKFMDKLQKENDR